jgi:hypothetical protein
MKQKAMKIAIRREPTTDNRTETDTSRMRTDFEGYRLPECDTVWTE